jgi:hypothetical protein
MNVHVLQHGLVGFEFPNRGYRLEPSIQCRSRGGLHLVPVQGFAAVPMLVQGGRFLFPKSRKPGEVNPIIPRRDA